MTALQAAAVRCQTMADGTLRLVLDIEPRDAQQGFRLFGSPGTPVALAAIKTKPQQQASEPERAKGGVAAKWLGMRCAEPEFQQWLRDTYPGIQVQGDPVTCAAIAVRAVCQVESRAEIDNDQEANERFQRLIRGPWAKYQGSRQ